MKLGCYGHLAASTTIGIATLCLLQGAQAQPAQQPGVAPLPPVEVIQEEAKPDKEKAAPKKTTEDKQPPVTPAPASAQRGLSGTDKSVRSSPLTRSEPRKKTASTTGRDRLRRSASAMDAKFAQEPEVQANRFPMVDELRIGAAATNLENGSHNKGNVVINGEALFGRFRSNYSDPVSQFLFNPRPHVGFSFNPHADGVSAGYAGLSWDLNLTDALFFEASFGGMVHTGDTASYGCGVLFRESASIGVNLTENTRIMATVDHSSNGFCDPNKGLTNAGVRVGYRW